MRLRIFVGGQNKDTWIDIQKDKGAWYIDWLVSPEGQKSIGNYKIDGEQLFYPNADDSNA
jgi:tungstate transport system substrate-binding protein